MSTLFPGASGLTITGGTFNAISQSINQSKRGFDILMENIATDALHDSGEQYDAPKCHPGTRVAVLNEIMDWVIGSDAEAQEEFMLWLFGPAGSGKSAIARKIAELAAEKGLLIGTFFFSRTSPTRSTQYHLFATLAYQLAVSVPEIRTRIEDAIERDPAIFKKSLQTQIDTLLIGPLQSVSMDTIPFPKLIIIDGLDECKNTQAQGALLDAISLAFTRHTLPVIFLIASRSETHLATSFNGKDPLKFIHRRLALDDKYLPDNDIRLFFSARFAEIQHVHRLRSTIPVPWVTGKSLDALVEKSSGQFIFAATVVRFVESDRHRPAARLNIILGISPPGTTNPFTELDALYKQILSSVDDIQLTLRVLSLYISLPHLASYLEIRKISEHFLSLEEGDIDRALIDLSSLVSYDELSGKVKILHASLADFLSDSRRSDEFYIDMASARTDFACRTLQYVKGPDVILIAGGAYLFQEGIMGGWILTNQLRNEILNFDLDAFITALIKARRMYDIITIFDNWMSKIPEMGLEDGDEQLLIHRCRKSFDSRMQKYQSDWQLQLLVSLALSSMTGPLRIIETVRRARCLDILLEMDDKNLHLVDRDALHLRYFTGMFRYTNPWDGCSITSRYVDADRDASAALLCMRFLSDPPKYSDTSLEMGITYIEWKETTEMALDLLCPLLRHANTSSEVIQYMSDHNLNTMVQKHCPVIEIWRVDTYILAFLARKDVCVNWRIMSAIRRGLSPTNRSAAARPPRFNSEPYFTVW